MFCLFLQLYILIARKGLPKGMTLTMGDHTIIVVSVHADARPILINVVWDFVLMFPLFKKFKQRKILRQARGFISWTQTLGSTAYRTHNEVIHNFIHRTYITDGLNITDEFIEKYSHDERTPYAVKYTKTSLTMFQRYCKRLIILPERAKLIVMKKNRGGRVPNFAEIKKVKKLREEGKSYRYISKKMKMNVSLVYRRAKYPADKLLKRELELSTGE